MSEPTCVYRLRSEDGTLLYIGISNDPDQRFKAHRFEKDWFDDVDHHDLTWYPTRREAAEAEVIAIRAEDPLYNLARSLRNTSKRDKRLTEKVTIRLTQEEYDALRDWADKHYMTMAQAMRYAVKRYQRTCLTLSSE